MKMHIDWAAHIQDRLEIMVAGPEDYTPIAFISFVLDKEKEHAHWQECVDVIYRLLKSGILKFTEYAGDDSPVIREPIELAQALASQNPFSDDEWIQAKEVPHWYIPLLSTTDMGKTLMRKHGLDKFGITPLCIALIDEIEILFEEAGVAWSQEPLIPVGRRYR
uniref:hypothetical protein n=1 Tax=Aerococcus urinaeequi TaxID=51665 RepID=UPI00352B053D